MKRFLFLVLTLISNSAIAKSSIDLISTPTARFKDTGIISTEIYSRESLKGLSANFQWSDSALFKLNRYKSNNDSDIYKSSLDLKFKAHEESRFIPQVAIGINSIAGDKDLESEYIVISKNFYNFDFSTGLAWGAMGTGGNIKNPLSFLGSHFSKNKDRETNNRLENLFTGERVNLFGGLSYKINPRFKFNIEYNNKEVNNLYQKNNANSSISYGLEYNKDAYTTSIGIENGNIFIAKLKYSFNSNKLSKNIIPKINKVKKINRKDIQVSENRLITKAHNYNINAYASSLGMNKADLWVDYQEKDNLTQNMFDSSRYLYNNTSNNIKKLGIVQTNQGLSGVKSSILREDLEKLDNNNLSLEALIKKSEFSPSYKTAYDAIQNRADSSNWFFKPSIDIDTSTKDKIARHRSYIIAGLKKKSSEANGLSYGVALRLNTSNNLKEDWLLAKGRGMEKHFANRRVNLENAYIRKIFKPFNNVYIDTQLGYLEEMHQGLATEVMYKPIMSNWGLSFDYNQVYQRQHYNAFGFYPSLIETGGLSFYYEPDYLENTILKFSVRQFLAGDRGLQLTAKRKFNNGAEIEIFSNISNQEGIEEYDAFRSNVGINLSFPIGEKHNKIATSISPMGLITGETLKKPESLYKDISNISYNNLIKF
ncbi:MAG: YjbH domain-containing protein [Alphaproteobacteria bacterium]|jgi:hypothetical protein|nr:YjbH domain-containing protein [Alphaproteobacteria bacterium]